MRRSRGLGDVYKRQGDNSATTAIKIIAPIPVGNLDLEVVCTGYTWLAPDRVRMGIRITNRGAAVVTSYKLKWEFAGRTGTWDVARTLNTGQTVSTGNVMYPPVTTAWPQTFKVYVVSVNAQPDNNPTNDVGTCVVNAM
jgi:hypothetical protein